MSRSYDCRDFIPFVIERLCYRVRNFKNMYQPSFERLTSAAPRGANSRLPRNGVSTLNEQGRPERSVYLSVLTIGVQPSIKYLAMEIDRT